MFHDDEDADGEALIELISDKYSGTITYETEAKITNNVENAQIEDNKKAEIGNHSSSNSNSDMSASEQSSSDESQENIEIDNGNDHIKKKLKTSDIEEIGTFIMKTIIEFL